jgi:hypothetical protein
LDLAAAAIADADPKPASDSIQGSAIVTPKPWRNVRRGTPRSRREVRR